MRGTASVHTVVDDHSRVAYAEIRDDERTATAVDVLHRAVVWFAGPRGEHKTALTDNSPTYRFRDWCQACAERGITQKKTRPAVDEQQGPTLTQNPRGQLGPGSRPYPPAPWELLTIDVGNDL
ncbi:DDE-type integrase/transposase/recombinase [Streptomyces massasporeus]|uniref:DDE-type integrase/transposase/recombinase n=1 Tax=Streptomyces massasporeus TaxID=67324 RepID=UPI0037FE7218